MILIILYHPDLRSNLMLTQYIATSLNRVHLAMILPSCYCAEERRAGIPLRWIQADAGGAGLGVAICRNPPDWSEIAREIWILSEY